MRARGFAERHSLRDARNWLPNFAQIRTNRKRPGLRKLSDDEGQERLPLRNKICHRPGIVRQRRFKNQTSARRLIAMSRRRILAVLMTAAMRQHSACRERLPIPRGAMKCANELSHEPHRQRQRREAPEPLDFIVVSIHFSVRDQCRTMAAAVNLLACPYFVQT